MQWQHESQMDIMVRILVSGKKKLGRPCWEAGARDWKVMNAGV